MRSTQTIKMSFKEMSMSVPSTQGMEAEKNRISETHTMAVTYWDMRDPLATILAGKNISARLIAQLLPIITA